MEQGGIILKRARYSSAAAAFRAFLTSAAGPRRFCNNTDSPYRRIDMDWQAIWLSVRLAAATTAILLAIGLPLAYWLAFSRRRWKFLVEAVVALPLVLPPTVLGFYVLLAMGPRSPLGALYGRLTGGMLPFSFQGCCWPRCSTACRSRCSPWPPRSARWTAS